MKPKKLEILLILCLALALSAWAFWPKKQGNSVSVAVNGEVVGEFSLSRDLSEPLEGYGGFSLTLVIEKGQARVEEATCPDLICQHHAPISRAGEQIVCLPARVVITVTGEGENLDAVVG